MQLLRVAAAASRIQIAPYFRTFYCLKIYPVRECSYRKSLLKCYIKVLYKIALNVEYYHYYYNFDVGRSTSVFRACACDQSEDIFRQRKLPQMRLHCQVCTYHCSIIIYIYFCNILPFLSFFDRFFEFYFCIDQCEVCPFDLLSASRIAIISSIALKMHL